MSKRAMETWLEGRTGATLQPMICGDLERLPLSIWTFRKRSPELILSSSALERVRDIGLSMCVRITIVSRSLHCALINRLLVLRY